MTVEPTTEVPGGLGRRESAIEAIRRAIILGELRPGQKLREVALAAEIGVSRPTLREALQYLAQEGLCTQERNRGFSVAELDAGAVRDLAETRWVLDRMAMGCIGQDADRLAAVDAAWEEYAGQARQADPLTRHTAHVQFHRALWEASGQSTLLRLWPVLESLSTLVLAQDQALRADTDRAVATHRQMVQALHSGDPERMDAALAEHTRRSAEEFLSLRAGGSLGQEAADTA